MATFNDAFVTGATIGLIVGSAAYAIRSVHRMRSNSSLAGVERSRLRLSAIAGAVVATFGTGLVIFAVSRPPDILKLQQGLFQGCQQSCRTRGGESLNCDLYCTCVVRELTAIHGPQGLNDLIIAASRKGEASATAALAEPAKECAARM